MDRSRIQYDIAALERMNPTQHQRQAQSQAQGSAAQLRGGTGDLDWEEVVIIDDLGALSGPGRRCVFLSAGPSGWVRGSRSSLQ